MLCCWCCSGYIQQREAFLSIFSYSICILHRCCPSWEREREALLLCIPKTLVVLLVQTVGEKRKRRRGGWTSRGRAPWRVAWYRPLATNWSRSSTLSYYSGVTACSIRRHVWCIDTFSYIYTAYTSRVFVLYVWYPLLQLFFFLSSSSLAPLSALSLSL